MEPYRLTVTLDDLIIDVLVNVYGLDCVAFCIDNIFYNVILVNDIRRDSEESAVVELHHLRELQRGGGKQQYAADAHDPPAETAHTFRLDNVCFFVL